MSGEAGVQDQAGVSQTQIPPRKHQNQPPVPISSTAIPVVSHPMPAHSLQMPQRPKGHLTPEMAQVSLPQSSRMPNVPPSSLHSPLQPHHQTPLPNASSQPLQPLQAPGIAHMPLQPPMPPQPRPSSAPPFHAQYPPQMGANMGFQHAGAPQNLPQSIFHVS